MAVLLHLVRHAEVDNPDHLVYAALPGYGLSRRGERQAAQAARHLAGKSLVAVWSSPLQRALHTADVIAARHRLPVRIDAQLTEWRLTDRWGGVRWEDLPWKRPGELEAYLNDPEGFPFDTETLADLAARVAAVARHLNEQNPDGEVVLVSHQDPVQAARLRLTGRALSTFTQDKPAHAEVLSLRPGPRWVEVARWRPEELEPFPPP